MSNNDYLDYLYHARSHKYIDKYLKNGKYVYVYKKAGTKTGRSFNVNKALKGAINPVLNRFKTTKMNKVFAPFTKQVDMLKKKAEKNKPIEIKKGTKLTQEQLNNFYRKQSEHTVGKPKNVDTYIMKDEYRNTPEKRKIYGSMPSGLYVKKNKKGEYVVQ